MLALVYSVQCSIEKFGFETPAKLSPNSEWSHMADGNLFQVFGSQTAKLCKNCVFVISSTRPPSATERRFCSLACQRRFDTFQLGISVLTGGEISNPNCTACTELYA